MSWYYAINQEQKGPVSEEEFRELARTGTITPATLVWQEGMPQWVPYSEVATAGAAGVPAAPAPGGAMYCAECGNQFNPEELVRFDSAYVCAACKPTFVQRIQEGGAAQFRVSDLSEEDVLAAPYEVDIGGCLSKGWNATTANLGTAIASMIVLLICYVIGAVVTTLIDEGIMQAFSIPFSPAGIFLGAMYGGPLAGGFFMLGIAMVRNDGADVGTALSGFSRFGSCVMCGVAQTFVVIVCMIPIGVVIGVLAAMSSGNDIAMIMAITVGVGGCICVAMYFSVCWIFSYHLIMDKGYGFWEAMSLSRKVVRRRWWVTFLFYFVAGFISAIGVILIFIGLLFTVPTFSGMFGALYEENLGKLRAKQV